ncbi:MAG: hypothetical protein C0617_04355 [Desulfuromonas sp.]|uniref:type II secretion system protein n=1 Tax=Desulfuromonas sp. TaxID=892 RepID=UPI000CC7AEC8|nr:type II secretion system protein [Desulfuromonas sp.]PLX85309.1 MAG: hypothetical protein C0617_04355 [Desulfuromonas sp.]
MNPLPILTSQRGVTLLTVLVMVVVMGLAAGMAGSTWRTVVQQAKEEELLFRGGQYRSAIESYYNGKAGGKAQQYPTSLEDLVEDPRFGETTRHLRKLFPDPMTGGEWIPIRQGGTITGVPGPTIGIGGIIGVRSSSDLKPFKKDGFSEEFEGFAQSSSYSEWEFVFRPKKKTPAQPLLPKAKGT